MKKLFLILSILTGFCSCMKDVDMNVPDLPSQLAINAVWKENDVLTASVSRTLNVKDKPVDWNQRDKYYVTNAQVSVYQNNVLYDQLVYDANKKKYKSASNKKAVPGFTYSLKVVAPGFTEATTEVFGFLPKVPIKTLYFQKEITTGGYNELLDEIRIEFDDQETTKNYYLVQVQQGEQETFHWVYPEDPDVIVSLSDDPFATDPGVNSNQIIFTDETFNGKTKSLRLRVPSYYLRDWQNRDRVKGTITLYNISKDMFLHLRANVLYTENPFAEPVQSHTNIANGVGVFGLLAGDSKQL